MPWHNFIRPHKFIFSRKRDVHSKNHLKGQNKDIEETTMMKKIMKMQQHASCLVTFYLTLLLMLMVKNSSKL
jgi:hypothetical protein